MENSDKPKKKLRNIGIIGHVDHYKTILAIEEAAMMKYNPTIILPSSIRDDSFEVDGIRYIPRPKKEKKSPTNIEAITHMYAGVLNDISYISGSSLYTRERPKVNLIEEYKLVLAKQSKLSRSDRNWVEYMFHKTYIKLDDIK